MYISSLSDLGWTEPVELPGMDVGSYKSPAVAVLGDTLRGDTLHIVFNSNWSDKQLWGTSTTDGKSFSRAAAIPRSYTDNQPALVAHDGELGVVWTRHLGDRAIYHQYRNAQGWSTPFAVVNGTATSDRGPGLASYDGRLFLAWSDGGSVYHSSWRAHVWQPKRRLPVPQVTSHRGVSLSAVGRALYVGWNGDGRAGFASRGER